MFAGHAPCGSRAWGELPAGAAPAPGASVGTGTRRDEAMDATLARRHEKRKRLRAEREAREKVKTTPLPDRREPKRQPRRPVNDDRFAAAFLLADGDPLETLLLLESLN